MNKASSRSPVALREKHNRTETLIRLVCSGVFFLCFPCHVNQVLSTKQSNYKDLGTKYFANAEGSINMMGKTNKFDAPKHLGNNIVQRFEMT